MRGSFYCGMIEWASCLACKSSFSVCLLKILCSGWYFGKHLMMMPKDFLPRFVLTFESHEGLQGCALAKPGDPWCQTFALGQLENLRFFVQIICWAPWILQVQCTGLPSIFLRAQSWVVPCYLPFSLAFLFFFLLLLKSWALYNNYSNQFRKYLSLYNIYSTIKCYSKR